MRHLQKTYEEYGSKGLVILGFNCADRKQIALDMLRKNSVTFPNILDSSEAARKTGFRDYRSSGVPLNYLIEREGKVVDAWYGYRKGHPRAMRILRKLGIVPPRQPTRNNSK